LKGWDELQFAGVDRGDEMIDFLHDSYFSAVAGDAPSFESWPMNGNTDLHYFLLPRWGVPIGELWDLDGLAELCEKLNRYEFFFTSSPSNVQGMCFPQSKAHKLLLYLTLFHRQVALALLLMLLRYSDLRVI
jgi:hypothetical protein